MDLPRIRTFTLLASFLSVFQDSYCENGLGNLEYVGCFDTGYSLRQKYRYESENPTLGNCLKQCLKLKTKYVGIDASTYSCFCGGDISEESWKRNDSLCNVPCLGMSDRTCGGDWVTSVYNIKSISLPDYHVGFLIGLSVGVRLYNSSNLDGFDTLMSTPGEWVFSVDYHLKKKLLFAYSKKKIFRTSMDKGSGAPVAISTATTCEGMAVDWEHDKIYWVSCGGHSTPEKNTIMSMDLDGGNVTSVLARPESAIKRMEIDPYAGMLFWVSHVIIESCELSGSNFVTNVSAANVVVRILTLDLKARRVYYVGSANQTTTLFSMNYDGSNSVEHARLTQMRSVYGLGLLAGRLYWVNYANNDVIYTAPLPLNSTDNVLVLMEVDRVVWHMRLVHPDLQNPPRRDPCELQGCSHSCVSQSPTLASCSCPHGLTLAADQVNCTVLAEVELEQEWKGQEKWLMTVVLMLIAVVLLLTVTLLYFTDKYWPQLQAKLSGLDVPYSRKRECDRENSVTPVYNTNEDNVNLI